MICRASAQEDRNTHGMTAWILVAGDMLANLKLLEARLSTG